jgi:hypothetical protein
MLGRQLGKPQLTDETSALRARRSDDCIPNRVTHRPIVGVVAIARCLDPSGRFEAHEVQPVASLQCQRPEILQLCPPVTFAKRMNVVHVANDDCRAVGNLPRTQARKKTSSDEPAVDVCHSGGDELPELKLLTPSADFDRTKLTGPCVNVLEEMTVNGAEMGQVE